MGKRKRKSKRGKVAETPAAAVSATGPARSRPSWYLFLAALVVLLAIALASAVLLRSESAPEIPELDLETMEPQVAAKLTERVAAVRAAPSSHEAWGALAMALQAHGLEREAAACYEKAVALEPGEFRWRYLLVHALRPGAPEKALEAARDAVAVDDTYSPAHVILAELLEQQNEMDAALEHYEKALALDPQSPIAAFGVARLYFAREETEKAAELLERAEQLDPEAGAIHATLARVYRRLGKTEKAAAEAQLAFEKKNAVAIPDPIHFTMRQESVSSLAQLDRAIAASAAGDRARAESILRELVRLRPDDADMRARFGDALIQQGKLDEAREQYRAALEINPEQAGALYGMANARNAEGNVEEAESLYRKAREVRPDHVETLLNLGSLRAFRGDAKEAESLFRRGLELDPRHFGCHRQLGELLLRQERVQESIEQFRAALDERPEFGAVHASLAAALARDGRFEDAWTQVKEAERLGAPLPEGFVQELSRFVK